MAEWTLLSLLLPAVILLHTILIAFASEPCARNKGGAISINGRSSNCTTSDGCLCRPKTMSELENLYTTHSYNSGCAKLTKVEVPMGDGFSWTHTHVITGKSSCFETIHHNACFNVSSLTPHCSWKKTWIDLGEDHFPRFISNLECRGGDVCTSVGTGPRYFEVFRRQGRCDSRGVDVWEKVVMEQRVNFVCSCIKRR